MLETLCGWTVSQQLMESVLCPLSGHGFWGAEVIKKAVSVEPSHSDYRPSKCQTIPNLLCPKYSSLGSRIWRLAMGCVQKLYNISHRKIKVENSTLYMSIKQIYMWHRFAILLFFFLAFSFLFSFCVFICLVVTKLLFFFLLFQPSVKLAL